MWGKKKEKVKPKSGYLGDMSPEQDECLTQLKRHIDENALCSYEQYDDYDLLRFCRARKFEIKAVIEMFVNMLNWRKENNVDEIITSFEIPERLEVQQYYPHGYHKTDKWGRTLYIERTGMLNTTELWKVTTEDRMMQHTI